jgi:hypothetical protein
MQLHWTRRVRCDSPQPFCAVSGSQARALIVTVRLPTFPTFTLHFDGHQSLRLHFPSSPQSSTRWNQSHVSNLIDVKRSELTHIHPILRDCIGVSPSRPCIVQINVLIHACIQLLPHPDRPLTPLWTSSNGIRPQMVLHGRYCSVRAWITVSI